MFTAVYILFSIILELLMWLALFAIPFIIFMFIYSLIRFIFAKVGNKKTPGKYSDDEINNRKKSFIIFTVLFVLLIAAAVAFYYLLLTGLTAM